MDVELVSKKGQICIFCEGKIKVEINIFFFPSNFYPKNNFLRTYWQAQNPGFLPFGTLPLVIVPKLNRSVLYEKNAAASFFLRQ